MIMRRSKTRFREADPDLFRQDKTLSKFVAALSFGILLIACRDSSVKDSSLWESSAQDSVDIPAHPNVLEQAKRFPESYESILQDAWAGDSLGLGAMFGFEDLAGFSGAASDEHRQLLWALLQRNGDSMFATVLEREPARIRGKVIAAIEKAAGPGGLQRFPRTAGLGAR
jgi:hypothetical protein